MNNIYKIAASSVSRKTEAVVDIKEYFKDPEPLTTYELITSSGFIKIITLIWSPIIITILFMLLYRYIQKRRRV